MTWRNVNKVCQQSDCLTYFVAAYRTATGIKYQAFRGRVFLHIADNAAECKKACEADSEARPIHHHAHEG